MSLNFRKVSAIAASALMVGMTMGVAAAANYPAPFVSGGSANVAVVYGTGSGVSSLDLVQAGNIQANLQSYMSGGTGTSTSVSGEAVDLGTSGTRIYIADTINKVKSILTKSDLPTILADGSFSGNVDSSYTQTVTVGAYPNITYEKQPTSSDDPNLAIKLSTNTGSAAFNMTVSFSKVVNFTSADSKGQDIVLFGKSYTVSSATDGTNLVLLQSAKKLNLDSNTPSADVIIGGNTYTVTLQSASSTDASIQVTNKATGATDTKTVSEAQSKKIAGLTVAVTSADSNNLKYSAAIVAGSEKVTLTSSSYVKTGETDTAVLGTNVDFGGGSPGAGLSKITISVTAADSDKDAIKVGQSLIDPVFKTIKLSLGGFNEDENSAQRENIKVDNSGDNKLQVGFTDYAGNTVTQRYAFFGAGPLNTSLYVDDNHANLSVKEMEKLHRDDYVMVGNEDEGHLLRVSSLLRTVSGGSTASGDQLSFIDVMSGKTLTASLTSNTSTVSTGTVDIGGKRYTVYLEGPTPTSDQTVYNVTIDYPDSSGNNVIIYPTISTSKGAKLAFYETLNIPYNGWQNGSAGGSNNLSGILIPNGAKAYQTIGIGAYNATGPGVANSALNVTCAGVTTPINTSGSVACVITNTGFTYNISYIADTPANSGAVTVTLLNVAGTGPITNPAVTMLNGKDDNNRYEGLIVISSLGSGSTAGAGVSDVERTWTQDGLWDSVSMASNTKLMKEMDLWGNIITTDTSGTQYKATISYPKEQVYALAYMGAADSSAGVSGGGAGAQLGDVLVKDSDVSSVSSKNLIVVGGSCINTVASTLLGGAGCGSSFTDKTGIGSGQFLIQSLASTYSSNNVALVVAGYDAADTVAASTYLRNNAVDTTSGKKYTGTTSTMVATQVASS